MTHTIDWLNEFTDLTTPDGLTIESDHPVKIVEVEVDFVRQPPVAMKAFHPAGLMRIYPPDGKVFLYFQCWTTCMGSPSRPRVSLRSVTGRPEDDAADGTSPDIVSPTPDVQPFVIPATPIARVFCDVVPDKPWTAVFGHFAYALIDA